MSDAEPTHTIRLRTRWKVEFYGHPTTDRQAIEELDCPLPFYLSNQPDDVAVPGALFRRQFNWVAPLNEADRVELVVLATPGGVVRLNEENLGSVAEEPQQLRAPINRLLKSVNRLEIDYPTTIGSLCIKDAWLEISAMQRG